MTPAPLTPMGRNHGTGSAGPRPQRAPGPTASGPRPQRAPGPAASGPRPQRGPAAAASGPRPQRTPGAAASSARAQRPPAAAASRQRPRRATGGEPRPRRISGPLRGRLAAPAAAAIGEGTIAIPTAPRLRPRRPQRRRRPAAPIGARAVSFVRSLPDHALLDRLIRGRVWIPLLGVLLAGIVAMQVEVLKLGASIGRSIQRSSALQIHNESLRATVASLDDDQRIEALAAKDGMVMAPPDGVGFLSARSGNQIQRVLSGIRTPNAASFLALTTANGMVTTATGSDPSAAGQSSASLPTSAATAPVSGSAAIAPSSANAAPAPASGTTAANTPGSGGASSAAAPQTPSGTAGSGASARPAAAVGLSSAAGAAASAPTRSPSQTSSASSGSGTGGSSVSSGG